jgi:hypothetical protein
MKVGGRPESHRDPRVIRLEVSGAD